MNSRSNILISTLSLQNKDNVVELMNRGYGIEIFADELDWTENKTSDDLFVRFDSERRVLSLHAPFADLNLASEKYPTLRDLSFNSCIAWIHTAKRIGCRYIVIHPNNSTVICNRSEVKRRICDSLQALAEISGKAGILLLAENVGICEQQLFDQDEYIWLIRSIPNLFALLDTGHAFINKWDIPSTARSLSEKLISLHIHDNHGEKDEHLPVGIGIIDWISLWDELVRMPLAPYLVLEYCKAEFSHIIKTAEEIEGYFSKQSAAVAV